MVTLEELLAEDGFKRGRHKQNQCLRGGASESSAESLASRRFGSSGTRTRPARTRSDFHLRRKLSIMPEKGGFTEPRLSKAAGRSLSVLDWYEEQSPDVHEPKGRIFISTLKQFNESEGSSGRTVGSSKSLMGMESTDDYSEEVLGKLEYNRFYKNGLYEEGMPKLKKPTRISLAKPCLKDIRDEPPVAGMDEAALKAIAAVINTCVDRLIKDDSFRSSVHHGCVSSLNSNLLENRQPEDRVLSTLKETIGDVERIITEGPSKLELKKASLKLSVITGLKSMESDAGHACGIANSHLAACAHLYLSILYKMQKKDKVSAKHLLQVFCDSPFQARTTLLPGLWERLFLPHLSNMKAWYEKKVESVQDSSGMLMKLDFLENVYNDHLDMGTSQYAAYYNGWLMGDNRDPTLPSIPIPFAPVPEIEEDANEFFSVESFNSSNSIPSKTMISKRLYESVLGQSRRSETSDEVESGEEEEDEIEEGQSDVWSRRYHGFMQKDEETWSQSPKSGTYAADSFQGNHNRSSQDLVAYFEENDQKYVNSCGSTSSSILELKEIKLSSEMFQSFKGYAHIGKCDQWKNENERKLKMLAQPVFQLQVTDHSNDENTYSPKQSIYLPVSDSYQDEMTEATGTEFFMDETDTMNGLSSSPSLKETSSNVVLGYREDIGFVSLFSRVPKDFICPLTGQLLKEPVTLESGYTFELAAIKERFNQGIKTCPVTGQSLKGSSIPDTNLVLKHMINEWAAECFRNALSLASQSTFSPVKEFCNSKYELALLIIDQLVSGISSEEEKENIKHLISLGGLQFLTKMMEIGSLEEKSRAAGLLTQYIRFDGFCRNYLAINIRKSSLLELIHSKQVHARSHAASLLIELICLNRRMDIMSFISGLKTEVIGNTKHELLVYLQSSLPEEGVLVAVVLLHLDLMEESQMFSVYKEEAVKCITVALECCLSSDKFIANCRRALLMLGGHFSFSGEILIETWLLKKAGYDSYSNYNDEVDQTVSKEEARKREDWLKSISLIFLSYGKKSFLETLSKCWKSGCPDLVKVCLLTTAWLSHALASLSAPSLQLSVFLALSPRLKECLRSDQDIKLRVLASFCLLNFSTILECRIPLISFADEIYDPLRSLAEVTWTAKHLYNDIFEENI